LEEFWTGAWLILRQSQKKVKLWACVDLAFSKFAITLVMLNAFHDAPPLADLVSFPFLKKNI